MKAGPSSSLRSSRRGAGQSGALWRRSAGGRDRAARAVRGADRPTRAQRAVHRSPSRGLPFTFRLPVCLSLPWGAAAGGNHGVRSR